jgi:hypothetical protein
MRFWTGLVIVCVVLLLGSLLAVGLLQSQEQSRLWRCQAHLRDFGLGLLKFSQQDPQTRYCTGAYDWEYDGCPDTIGWVADLVNSGSCRPGEMLCPANPMQGNEKLMQLYLRDAAEIEMLDPNPALIGTGVCGAKPNVLGQVYTPERQHAIEQHILALGYNTNYAASWYLVRGGIRLSVETQKDSTGNITSRELLAVALGPPKHPAHKPKSWRGLADTTGPLKRKDVERSRVPSSQIPLLGDAAAGDPFRAISSVSLHCREQLAIQEGDRLTASFCSGPARFATGMRLYPLSAGSVLAKAATQGDTWNWEWTDWCREAERRPTPHRRLSGPARCTKLVLSPRHDELPHLQSSLRRWQRAKLLRPQWRSLAQPGIPHLQGRVDVPGGSSTVAVRDRLRRRDARSPAPTGLQRPVHRRSARGDCCRGTS